MSEPSNHFMPNPQFQFGDYVKCRSYLDGEFGEWITGFRFISHVPGFGYIVKADLSPSSISSPLRAHLYCVAYPEGKARAEAEEARLAALLDSVPANVPLETLP